MRIISMLLLMTLGFSLMSQPAVSTFTKDMRSQVGYFNVYSDLTNNKVYLEVPDNKNEFLYIASLSDGLGSNDIGLDRGKLGDSRLCYFERQGSKLLLIQKNLDYRAESNNPLERKAVEEAFARSALYGFDIKATSPGKVLIDISNMLLSDAYGVAQVLKSRGQGNYKMDAKTSSIRFDQIKSFPKNTELEAFISFKGQAQSGQIRSVTPEPNQPTVAIHHSFIELPDKNYKKRAFRPDCGYFYTSYMDYATGISQDMTKRYINRHRLEKKNPGRSRSEAVEPIIYYMDSGCPEPVKSALMEGAAWWNEAFEAAGFVDAFQVKVLPPNADPLDIRYNMIQWVHRSTRGWSYGASVKDPRTGEIIKGHVSLGSLRVRQDFMIAVGLIDAYRNGNIADPEAEKMALARLRQLAAHEVGHTIGLAHNFAASTNDRASVMDYPHPLATFSRGKINLDDAYDTGIGEWDIQAIKYGYAEFSNEQEGLEKILQENDRLGLRYITDQDSRPAYSFHPYAHLWDNGEDAVRELKRIMDYRAERIRSFSDDVLPDNTPLSEMERLLVPLYLSPRYQMEAVAKLIGGQEFYYSEKGDKETDTRFVNHRVQQDALTTLLALASPDQLEIPENVLRQIPPMAYGYQRGREYFSSDIGNSFDPVAAAESFSEQILHFLLHPTRLNRIAQQWARDDSQISLEQYLEQIEKNILGQRAGNKIQEMIILNTVAQCLDNYFALAVDETTPNYVRMLIIEKIEDYAEDGSPIRSQKGSRYFTMKYRIYKNTPEQLREFKKEKMPDGSPIGSCNHVH